MVSQAPLSLQSCLWPPILDLAGAFRVSKFGTVVFFSNIHSKPSVVHMSLDLATAQLICGILSHSLLPGLPSRLLPAPCHLENTSSHFLLHPLLLSVLPVSLNSLLPYLYGIKGTLNSLICDFSLKNQVVKEMS